MDDLKPCPFCGGKADLEEHDWAATCFGCGFSYSGEGFDSLEQLADKWNRRPARLAVLEAVAEACFKAKERNGMWALSKLDKVDDALVKLAAIPSPEVEP
jgi:hypothetical protein